jgi:hypothetical protein
LRNQTIRHQSVIKSAPDNLPVSTGVNRLQRQCACGQHTSAGGECEECKKKREGTLQRAAINPSPVNEVPPIVHEVLRSPGRPLDAETRAFMEPRFGHDFSQVRVHTDAKAAESARAVNGLAYTVGQDVVFRAGQYTPETREGRQLLAHELVHTRQQVSNPNFQRFPLEIGPVNDIYEHEADRMAAAIEADNIIGHASSMTKIHLQRKPAGGASLPLCPEVKNLEMIEKDFKDPKYRKIFTDINCLSSESQAIDPACRFSPDQEEMLEAAQKEAAVRAKRGLNRVEIGKEGRDLAQEMAGRLFENDPPTVREVVTRLRAVSNFLNGSDVRFAGRTCGDQACQRGTVAYVDGPHSLPIHICPTAFSMPSSLHRTVLHEALHWSGLDADPSTPEGYCKKFDCKTPCLDKEVADAWAHYLDCLGEPIESRRSFREKILESVNEIP